MKVRPSGESLSGNFTVVMFTPLQRIVYMRVYFVVRNMLSFDGRSGMTRAIIAGAVARFVSCLISMESPS
ncbi:MAG: hypothetical protein DVS81_08345 [Candidatus Accumulibacter meliphilus]|jgi:hypothetical protein|uniref:Uncharacterized protein n=1 Tax=Candidatus Accumulibacter meliphilus TaxID=2211374 RepID=A0A369XQ67_9PROT|nr:MAG: hypothetical protein DVS81_08345 [Candidatus Accumulibacter meliphilus]